MRYQTIMVQLPIGQTNARLLQFTAELAAKFDAEVIGVSACQPMQIVYGEGFFPGELITQSQKELLDELAVAQAEFRAALQSRVRQISWRSNISFGSLAEYFAHQARSADIFVASVLDADALDTSRRLDIGDLIVQIGRPVLVLPATITAENSLPENAGPLLNLERVLVCWSDSRESRRAIVDALPLLKNAARVKVIEVVPERDKLAAQTRLIEVSAWLASHGVSAEAEVVASTENDAKDLHAAAKLFQPGLIVAGAYGHSRLREWVLGSVTRELITQSQQCTLLSH